MIKIGRLRPTIGHMVLNTALYFENNNDFTIIVSSKREIANIALYYILKDKYQKDKKAIFLLGTWYIFLYRVICRASKYIPFFSKIISNIYTIHHESTFEPLYGSKYKFYSENTFDKFCSFNIYSSSILEFKRWKNENNITGKFVCIFSRDSAYWNEGSLPTNNIRNSSISQLLPTIDYLIKKGYFVVRIGRNHNDESDLCSHSKYIDYSKSQGVSDIIDIMLIRECEYFIGSNSGIANVQLLFNTKMILLNWAPAGMMPSFLNCQYILKRYEKNGRFIPFNLIDKSILLSEDSKDISNKQFSLRENSKDEILEFVADCLSMKNTFATKQKDYNFIVSKGRANINSKWIEKNSNLFL